ncbi:Gfo/Idh/MocA family protein [Paenibacillus hamazuiensis]|uniref:Gfo/Idh/MocA family protein n=1 Tax=Paenibacillus hamazuiensis TaxID=2936508 RepID=UPI00200C77CF|nr:Gfo/Idh/MocA family oxidoreductase [Paenibacillus hamazuiensis]
MIRFAVIGTNWITEKFIDAARQTGEIELAAVYSRTEEQAGQFAEKLGIPHRFTDLEAMAGSGAIDAVYIASPNSLHAQQAVLLMNHGKHVLCEKPIASNSAELKAMIEAAQQNGVLLMEAMKSTLMPNFEAVRDHLHKLGRIRRYVASFCQYSSRYDAYKQGAMPNAFNPAFSNGSLMDLGVYCIYPMVVLFGKPQRVKASAVLLGSGVDGEGSLIAEYGDMDAVIYHSKITHSALPSEIHGEDATMVIDKISAPGNVEIRFRDGSVETLTQPQVENTMYYEAKHFAELLKQGKRECATNSHANSLLAMEVMDEARRQAGPVFPADRK